MRSIPFGQSKDSRIQRFTKETVRESCSKIAKIKIGNKDTRIGTKLVLISVIDGIAWRTSYTHFFVDFFHIAVFQRFPFSKTVNGLQKENTENYGISKIEFMVAKYDFSTLCRLLHY